MLKKWRARRRQQRAEKRAQVEQEWKIAVAMTRTFEGLDYHRPWLKKLLSLLEEVVAVDFAQIDWLQAHNLGQRYWNAVCGYDFGYPRTISWLKMVAKKKQLSADFGWDLFYDAQTVRSESKEDYFAVREGRRYLGTIAVLQAFLAYSDEELARMRVETAGEEN